VKRRGVAVVFGALVLPLAFAACGGGSTSGTKTASGAQTTQPAASTGAPASEEAPLADPCTLSTNEIVSSTFSVKANGPNPGEDAAGGAECKWTWLDPVQGPCNVVVAPRALRRFDLFKGNDAEDISGVGDAAYREPKNDQPNNISARTGGSYVYITMRCNGDGTNGSDGFTTQRQTTLNNFAKQVVQKL
jgi:hypothetical protein